MSARRTIDHETSRLQLHTGSLVRMEEPVLRALELSLTIHRARRGQHQALQ